MESKDRYKFRIQLLSSGEVVRQHQCKIDPTLSDNDTIATIRPTPGESGSFSGEMVDREGTDFYDKEYGWHPHPDDAERFWAAADKFLKVNEKKNQERELKAFDPSI